MSRDQILTFAILLVLVVLFLWDRLRYDLVALIALLAAIAAGIVPADKAFNGFSNPVLPLIGAALIVSAGIGQSGAIEVLLRWLTPVLRSQNLQIGVLVACVAVLSAFMKNIGALAIFISAALQVARRNKRSPSEFLMPLSFASLLGGSMTLIGTSPNLLASAVRQELTGQPFHMFDFTPVGAGIALVGVIFLSVGWRLLPHRRGAASGANFTIEDYTSEVRLPEKSPFVGRTVGEIEKLGGGEIGITALIREGGRRQIPTRRWKLYADDVLVVEADPQSLEQFARDGNLELVGVEKLPEKAPKKVLQAASEEDRVVERAQSAPAEPPPERPVPDDRRLSTVEAVIATGSDLIGRSAASLHLRERYGVNVLAIGRRGRLRSTRLRQARFKLGDAIVLQGHTSRLPDILTALGCLPLAERPLSLGRRRRIILPLVIIAAAIGLSGFELVPAQIAFVGAAVALVLCGLVSLKEAYATVEWPILILIGALIPIGEAVQQNGSAKLVATLLAGNLAHLPVFAVLAAILAATMLVTPILHHAAAVLVMGPIAASLAQQLGYKIDPFLMAVAFGAGSDFLSPIGHQSNTLVMGLGGYRFGDYWKLGLPLSIMVVALGVPLIMLFWPLH
ncbi:MAG TPA: SLC13 family permease [Stellaceae bacterium]|nr:SLC13 family permease [Stellaceae bacterium]